MAPQPSCAPLQAEVPVRRKLGPVSGSATSADVFARADLFTRRATIVESIKQQERRAPVNLIRARTSARRDFVFQPANCRRHILNDQDLAQAERKLQMPGLNMLLPRRHRSGYDRSCITEVKVARTFLLGTLFAVVAPVTSFAQTSTVPEGVGVADRQRPDYQPIGGRLGSFFLYPTVELKVDTSDNVRATTTNRLDDVAGVTLGKVKLQSNFSRHAINVQGYVDHSFHANVTTENVTRYGGQLDGVYDISANTKLTALVLADHSVEARSSFNSPLGARLPGGFDRYYAMITAKQKFGRLDVTGTVAYTSNKYANVTLEAGGVFDQRFRNADTFTGALAVGYMFRPGVSVIARGTVDRINYTLSADSPLQPGNLDRDSSGVRLEAGFRFELTSLLYGEVRGGYFKRSYSDARLQDTSGVSFGGELLWNASPLTSLRISADRRVEEAASTTIAGNLTTDLQASVDHELRANLVLSANVRHVNILPLGDLRASNELYAGAGARMWVSRQLSLRLRYRYADRNSPIAGRSFTENLATAGVQLTF